MKAPQRVHQGTSSRSGLLVLAAAALLLVGAAAAAAAAAPSQGGAAEGAAAMLAVPAPAPAPVAESLDAGFTQEPVEAWPSSSSQQGDTIGQQLQQLQPDSPFAGSGSTAASDGNELPADVQALLGSTASEAGGIGGVGGASSGAAGTDVFSPYAETTAGGGQPSDPSKRIGRMVSLLQPPPGYIMPDLSQEQQDAIPRLKQARQGAATVVYQRASGSLDAGSMNCGIAYLNSHFRDYFVGIPTALYRSGELCGLCVRITCVDAVCENALATSALFMVVDSCRDCQGNDLVVSARGFSNLTGGVDPSLAPTLQVAWEFESCASMISGGIRLMPSGKTTPQFLALQFSNLRAPLRGAAINGLRMQNTTYGYWVIDTPGKNIPLRPPYDLVLVSAQGQRLAVRLNSLKPQDLGVNF